MKKDPQQLERELIQLQHRLEQDTKAFQRVMIGGIFGGFAMVAALGIWVYLAYRLC